LFDDDPLAEAVFLTSFIMNRREVRIELAEAPRFNAKPPQFTPKERIAFNKWFKAAVANGWIRRSSARNTCSILFVPKKNSTELRCCVNYIPLNAITKSRIYAPRADRFLRNQITAHAWYSKIDLENAFYHMIIREDDRWKAAFRTPHGVYEPNVPMFGLKNAPGEFQLWIEEVLAEVLGECVAVHIDDILIHTHIRDECIALTKKVREILARNRVNINEAKSVAVVRQIDYCGLTYSHHSHRPFDRSDELATWPTPKNLTQLRAFLGTVNQFKDHVPRFGHTATPLYAATGKSWIWSEIQERAFLDLRHDCSNSMATANHDPTKPATMITDASLWGASAILKQRGAVTAIWSRSLTSAERNYTTNERELLAVVGALKAWTMYLDISPAILVKTDNMINATLLKPNQSNRRLNRWIADLQAYPIEWEHIPGETNPADGPSRRRDYRRPPKEEDA
jgi:hypothetical protein